MNDAHLSTFERAAKFIDDGDDFLVTTHFAPDGDAVGAALGMGVILTKMGKRFILAIDGGVSQKYDFLGEKESILDSSRVTIPGIFTNIIILDAGSYKRIGAVSEMVEPGAAILNIDHHISNDGFGDVACIDVEASSTCEILYNFARYLKLPVEKELASYLYIGVMTDTGRFRFANSTPRAFRICAELVECGADPAELTEAVYFDLPKDFIIALAKSLDTLEFHSEGRVAMMEYLEEKEIEDAEGFIDFALGIRKVLAAAFIRKMSDGRFKVSLRARDTLDVQDIAQSYGGGGHRKAAGFRYRGPLEKLKTDLLKTIIDRLNQ